MNLLTAESVYWQAASPLISAAINPGKRERDRDGFERKALKWPLSTQEPLTWNCCLNMHIKEV